MNLSERRRDSRHKLDYNPALIIITAIIWLLVLLAAFEKVE